jgi:hypothetical protein
MEIHKPKPIHNLRELASEIGVIVVGILIALGLEQAVESYHSHEGARAAEAAIVAELRVSYLTSLTQNNMRDCTTRQLASLAEAVGRGDQGELKRKLETMWLPSPMSWPDAAWQTTQSRIDSDQIDRDRRGVYALLYTFVETAREKQERYIGSLGRLRALAETGLADSPEVKAAEVRELAETIAALRDYHYVTDGLPRAARDLLPRDFEFTADEIAHRNYVSDEPKCAAAAEALAG